MWRMATTSAALVAAMTASTSRKLPKVSRPIESGNDRIRCKIAASAGGMVNGTGFNAAIYDVFRVRGNTLARQSGRLSAPETADFRCFRAARRDRHRSHADDDATKSDLRARR